jgi:hypothetical protein
MDTTLMTAPETEIEDQEVDTQADEIEAETPDTGDESQQEEAGPDDDFEDVEIDGKVFRVQKDAKPYLMKNADYTQKTQTLAEERRQLQAEREEFQQKAESQKAFLDTVVAVQRMDAELAELQDINFEQLAMENPQEANRLWFRMQQLRDNRANAAGHAQNISQQQAEANERARVNAQQKALAELSTPKPDLGWAGKFDQETSQALTKTGVELGFDPSELSRVDDPRIIRTINLARIGLQTLKKQTAAQPAAPKAAPVPQVGGNKAKGTVDPDKMTTEQWAKWRDAQVRKARG